MPQRRRRGGGGRGAAGLLAGKKLAQLSHWRPSHVAAALNPAVTVYLPTAAVPPCRTSSPTPSTRRGLARGRLPPGTCGGKVAAAGARRRRWVQHAQPKLLRLSAAGARVWCSREQLQSFREPFTMCVLRLLTPLLPGLLDPAGRRFVPGGGGGAGHPPACTACERWRAVGAGAGA